MNDEQRKEIRQQFWDDDYFDGLPNKGELLKHFINEYGKAIERQQQAEIEALKAKTLTDGEILNIYLEQTNGNKDLDILEFAKLILKKAGEK